MAIPISAITPLGLTVTVAPWASTFSTSAASASSPRFVGGVVELYRGLLHNDRDRVVGAYETWGFTGLDDELIDILNIWARFIYGPLLEIGCARSPTASRQPTMAAARPLRYRALKEKGPVRVPREFVFMDRAAIGLGGVFIHLRAELNFHRLFNEALENFDIAAVEARQEARSLSRVGIVSV